MSEPDATRDQGLSNSDSIQTVAQLKEWLKGFPDHYLVLGAFQGQPCLNLVQCRHAEGHVIIEVPQVKPQS